MRAGSLRHRITVQKKTVTGQDSHGQDTISWTTTLGPFWAEVRILSGKELEQAQQRWATAEYRVMMRQQPLATIKREDRILFGTRTLDILHADDPDGRKREFQLICREIVS